jgi:hypothetical protein
MNEELIIGILKDVIQECEGNLDIPEIRVWCHPLPHGDDFHYVFNTFKEAMGFIKTNIKSKEFVPESQPMIAHGGYEFNIFDVLRRKHDRDNSRQDRDKARKTV